MLLSAALIVRNEEKFLESCLLSIRGLVDEIIVVDTGSTDRTQAIALEQGAKLHEFKWKHDFAAARNHALDLARGKWILYIDADERVHPADAARFREKLLDPSFVAHSVQLHPRLGSTAYPELRIFRNDPLIRFCGRIHENIWPGINLYRSQRGGRIGTSELVLSHEGYEGDQYHKHRRNLPLLRMALKEDPGRVFSWCHLANIYTALGKERQGMKAWKRVLNIVRKKKNPRSEDSLPFIGMIRWKLRHNQNALALINEAIRRFPANLQLHWLHGKILMDAGHFKEAIGVFEHVLSSAKSGQYDHAIAYDKRLLDVFPLSELATCYFKLQDYGKSGLYFEQALQIDSSNLEYRVKRALCSKLEISVEIQQEPSP